MIRRWRAFTARIDALSLRERVLIFACTGGVIVFAAYTAGLGPLLRKQTALTMQISQQQNNLAGMDTEIAAKLKAYERDPDDAARARMAAVKAESAQLDETLRAMQKGLVPPERMAPLIDTILRANGRLKLVSMRTLPVTSLNEAAPAATPVPAAPAPANGGEVAAKMAALQKQMASATAGTGFSAPAAPSAEQPPVPAPAAAVTPKAGSLLYRHGVEITVRGNYLDMIDYMNALESMPTQLFWGGASLEVEDFPTSRLTLTMYTLSLDSKWLKL